MNAQRSAVVAEVLEEAPKPILLAGENGMEAGTKAGHDAIIWSRGAATWPPDGPFASAALRLPRDKGAYEMALHAIAARLPPGAPLFVFGANDEGIKSAAKSFAPFFDKAETVMTRGHARVWRATRSAVMDGLKSTLAAWRRVSRIDLPAGSRDWVAYPGVFAKGGLDAGTALLLCHLPEVRGLVALDFAAGSGVIARALVDKGASVTMLERDAVALQAARENVPEGHALLGANLPEGRFDLIVSNPPIHAGKARDLTVLTALIAEAPKHLNAGGILLLVVQMTVPVPRLAEAHFPNVALRAEEGGFRVWQLTQI